MRKTRPAVILSPDEMNQHLQTVLIAPLTSTLKGWPSRAAVRFEGRKGELALDQLRAVSKQRLEEKLGDLPNAEAEAARAILLEMFAP